MATDIKGVGTPPPADPGALRNVGKDSGTAAASEHRAPQAPAAPNTPKISADNVNLSSQALSLKALEEKIQKLPDVNAKKVAEVKAALASGDYKVNDLVVADKLLGLDELFK